MNNITILSDHTNPLAAPPPDPMPHVRPHNIKLPLIHARTTTNPVHRGVDVRVQALEAAGKSFIDVGIGVDVVDGSVNGIVRVTTSMRWSLDVVRAKCRIPMTGDGGDNAYARNIQIADLNALNAALAVIRWKKLLGFYTDLEGEHFTAYSIDGNHLLNEDAA